MHPLMWEGVNIVLTRNIELVDWQALSRMWVVYSIVNKFFIIGNYTELPAYAGDLDNLLGGRNGCYN